jgi:DNA polymerase delta subunit 3
MDDYRMLYDFHRTQNARKPGSLHATYLVAGTRKPEAQASSNGHTSTSQADEDVPMSDISFLNSSMPDQDGQAEITSIPVTTITLVKEEELEGMLAGYLRVVLRRNYAETARCQELV